MIDNFRIDVGEIDDYASNIHKMMMTPIFIEALKLYGVAIGSMISKREERGSDHPWYIL